MEKFAVDLDKVLDEFEFNEDCAEQVASTSDSEKPSVAPTASKRDSGDSSICGAEDNRGKVSPSLQDQTLDIRKAESKLDNSGSINDFYNRGRRLDDKLQPKRHVDYSDMEPVALMIYNDISQKFVQKRQNESCTGKNRNSYDKKLNQGSAKPSISNVFSSLNDYINAPSGSAKAENVADGTIKSERPGPSQVPRASSEESEETRIVQTSKANKFVNTASTAYQNILLPVKYDSARNSSKAEGRDARTAEGASTVVAIGGNSGISLSSAGISVISGGVSVCSGAIAVNVGTSSKSGASSGIGASKYSKSSRSEEKEEHIYENVFIPGESRSLRDICSSSANPRNTYAATDREEAKHIYENVDFDAIAAERDEKDGAYARLYVGPGPSIGEVATDRDNSARAMKKSVTENPECSTFKSLVSNTPKSVIGFSTIDDLSEEELNKYLAELEAEERASEGKAMYENVSYSEKPRDEVKVIRHATIPAPRQLDVEDEDANEAPIFETVTIGELPTVSEEKLQEKAKKFPVIDYSKQQGSSSTTTVESRTGDFLEKKGPERSRATARTISGARITERRNEKLDEGNNRFYEETSDAETDRPEGNERCLTAHDAPTVIEKTITEPVENHSYENNTLASDLSSETTDSRGNDTDVADLECRIEESETGSIGEQLESDAQSNISIANDAVEACNDADDEDVLSGLPETTENGFANSDDNDQNSEEDKPSRPQTLDIVSNVSMDDSTAIGSPGTTPGTQELPDAEGNPIRDPSPDVSDNSSMESGVILGKQPPFWIPDGDAPNCMLCDVKFNVIKRRHHCRACGKVLCNKCCSMKYRLEYQGNIDSRVCGPCYQLLMKAEQENGSGDWSSSYVNNSTNSVNSPQGRQPNPNNPMEYCSTIPPLQQLAGGLPQPPTVMVPVGVLKREGSSKQRPEGQKSVMFSDGIRPGCDLTELDTSWDLKPPYRKTGNKRTPTPGQTSSSGPTKRQNMPPLDPNTNSYIPQDPDILPPTVTIHKGQISYHEVTDSAALYTSLKNDCEPPVMFAINRNLYAYVKITNLNCCVNKICWNITSRGLACVGQDEIILLVETLSDETQIPKDLLIHINQIYVEAIKGNTITELGVSIHQGGNFLGSREHAGFLFIRQTFQCLQKMVLPPAPFLVGLLVHRWETPWAKVFPLRLVLRLGAEYRYYPCPLVSVRFRDAVYFEIGHTIMKVLADFRNFAYTLPGVRGLTIHMQDCTTDILFPKNRYDQVIKGLNNSNDHVLAFASNFSVQADSHLVCIQTNAGDESNYQTQAINIHNKPRKVTGASFVVINGALKSSMGLSAKSSIVEDGLMVQIMPEKMEALKAALKNMQDFSIGCGLQGAPEPDETVNIKWVDNEVQFNLGVKSPIDGKPMDGVPSIRVLNGTDYMGTSRFIRWTEVFIIKSDDHPTGVHDPVDINKLSESIARATCAALVKLLDLLATAGLTKLAVRTTIHPDNVGYEAGSEGTRLPPIYMNSLDNELIQVLHKAAQSSQDTNTVLELIFHVLDD